jgi:hypothetical protein
MATVKLRHHHPSARPPTVNQAFGREARADRHPTSPGSATPTLVERTDVPGGLIHEDRRAA